MESGPQSGSAACAEQQQRTQQQQPHHEPTHGLECAPCNVYLDTALTVCIACFCHSALSPADLCTLTPSIHIPPSRPHPIDRAMSSALAAAAKQKQLRELMAKAKAGGATAAPAARITDRLAKYDANGQLSCAICKTSVQPAAWTAHTQGKQHQQVRTHTNTHTCTASSRAASPFLLRRRGLAHPPLALFLVASTSLTLSPSTSGTNNRVGFGDMMYTL